MTEKKNRNKKQSKAKTSSKVSKGNFGYFRSEKRRRLIITAILFAVPLFIFFTSWIYFKTRMTVWTVVTVVGCLPACKSMVNLIMILKCRPMDAGLYQKIHEHQGSLDMAYELYMTFYEKSAYIDAGQVIEDDKPCEKRYIHVFSEAGFPEITKPDILEIRKYKEDYLVLSYQRKLEGSRHSWEI